MYGNVTEPTQIRKKTIRFKITARKYSKILQEKK